MVLNDRYEPSGKHEDAILAYLEEEGRLKPTAVAEGVGSKRSAINHSLHRLTAAGWITKPHGHGLYEFAYDPREMDDEAVAAVHLDRALELLGYDDLDADVVVGQLLEGVEA